jgi:hypothetical protein
VTRIANVLGERERHRLLACGRCQGEALETLRQAIAALPPATREPLDRSQQQLRAAHRAPGDLTTEIGDRLRVR